MEWNEGADVCDIKGQAFSLLQNEKAFLNIGL